MSIIVCCTAMEILRTSQVSEPSPFNNDDLRILKALKIHNSAISFYYGLPWLNVLVINICLICLSVFGLHLVAFRSYSWCAPGTICLMGIKLWLESFKANILSAVLLFQAQLVLFLTNESQTTKKTRRLLFPLLLVQRERNAKENQSYNKPV